MSIFLMGCYDEKRDKWLTVTKVNTTISLNYAFLYSHEPLRLHRTRYSRQVHTGHDDATLAELQEELDMVKIGKDTDKLPSWLLAKKPMVPDFVARDPKVIPTN